MYVYKLKCGLEQWSPAPGLTPVRGSVGTGVHKKNAKLTLFLIYLLSDSEKCFILKNDQIFSIYL